ncbi:cytochrome P450 [Ktedonospora formicarum]|uniref:Cytochrome P450 n=1 Tax=Ktedonospora formicarum TaxID=2778364 RepID=A0A8J3ICD5_9CHLR|nr:cytochrome P450 [Ktedonospora formicarum]GHO48804.1 hypothetical protein KSX_69670 [Ktedonospora formicarum]
MSVSTHHPLSLKDVLDPRYLSHPYTLYQQLREQDPIYWDAGIQAWVLTRYDDVLAALHDPRLSSAHMVVDTERFPEAIREQAKTISRILSRQMLFADAPDHTHLRRLVSQAFTPRRIAGMRTSIQSLVNQLLDKAQAKGEMEVIEELAFPLPSIVIAEMIGVPAHERKQFATWATAFGALLDGAAHTPEEQGQAFTFVTECLEYFRQLMRKRRMHAEDDLLQALLDAKEHGAVLSEEEVLGNALLLLSAGHGTTIHAIGNGLLALLQNPDQYEALQKDATLIPAAVEELLRYDAPVQTTRRVAKEDLVLGNKPIRAWQSVIGCLGQPIMTLITLSIPIN